MKELRCLLLFKRPSLKNIVSIPAYPAGEQQAVPPSQPQKLCVGSGGPLNHPEVTSYVQLTIKWNKMLGNICAPINRCPDMLQKLYKYSINNPIKYSVFLLRMFFPDTRNHSDIRNLKCLFDTMIGRLLANRRST